MLSVFKLFRILQESSVQKPRPPYSCRTLFVVRLFDHVKETSW